MRSGGGITLRCVVAVIWLGASFGAQAGGRVSLPSQVPAEIEQQEPQGGSLCEKKWFCFARKLAVDTLAAAPFVRWITAPLGIGCHEGHGAPPGSARHGVQVMMMNLLMMTGMIGFHFLIPPHTMAHSGAAHNVVDLDWHVMCHPADAAVMNKTTGVHGLFSPHHGSGRPTSHDSYRCSFMSSGEDLSSWSDLESTSTGTQIGRLFLSMEIGMQLGHMTAIVLNRLVVDPLWRCCMGTDRLAALVKDKDGLGVAGHGMFPPE